MNNSELGAARRLLHQIGNQLHDGRSPEDVLASATRYCDRLELADRLLPALVLAWLSAGHKRGRDLTDMAGDGAVLMDLFTTTVPTHKSQPDRAIG